MVGDSAGTATDGDGNFSLSTTKKPPFDIEISSVGYGSTTATVTAANQKITVSLSEKASKLSTTLKN